MAWVQVSDIRWERPVDGLEGYFVVSAGISAGLCDGREHYTLFSKLKLKAERSDMAPALKHTWKPIRYEQPQIAITVDGMKKVYEVPDQKALEDHKAHQVSYAVLYTKVLGTRVSCPPPTIDGTGVFLFWQSYLKVLSSPTEDIRSGDEPARLAPTMEVALGYSEQPTKEMSETSTALFMEWAGSIPGIGPASQLGHAASGKCQNAELVFSADTTNALVTACREKGVTITAAVHAAYVRAIANHADPNSKLSQYVSASQFNLRSYLPTPYNSSKYAVSVYYSPLPYKIDLPVSYWDIAKSRHGYYQTSFRANPELLEVKGHFARALCSAAQSPEFLAGPVSKDALVSSLGIAERYVQREYGSGIEVQDLKMGVDVVMGMSMFFFYTFRDQLRLFYSFNDGSEKPEDIQKYLEKAQAILI
ncbi:hypothetical protein F4802DRAFT_597451 [Xylaria palmicola]|nr:hypothetical protein F4802DRAFT_597451 [Xylaria palmicola]